MEHLPEPLNGTRSAVLSVAAFRLRTGAATLSAEQSISRPNAKILRVSTTSAVRWLDACHNYKTHSASIVYIYIDMIYSILLLGDDDDDDDDGGDDDDNDGWHKVLILQISIDRF